MQVQAVQNQDSSFTNLHIPSTLCCANMSNFTYIYEYSSYSIKKIAYFEKYV